MPLFTSKETYLAHFEESYKKCCKELKELNDYIDEQFKQLEQLIAKISEENFWQLFPKVLGIDAKLNLVEELIQFEEFSEEEIIRITESDYVTYFKELCGYDLSMETKHSIIFNVS